MLTGKSVVDGNVAYRDSHSSYSLRDSILNTPIFFRRILIILLIVFYVFIRVFVDRYSIHIVLPWWSASLCAFLVPVVALAHREDGGIRAKKVATFGQYSLIFLIPWAIFAVLSVLWMLEGVAGYYHLTRPIMELVKLTGVACIIFGLGIEFGEKAADKFFAVIVVMYLVSFLYGLLCEGVGGFVSYLVYNSADVRKYYEVHDICLAMPMFIYYYWQMKPDASHRKFKISLAILISIAGFKRIALAAAFVALVLAYIVRIRKQRGIRFSELLIQMGLFAFALFWIVFTGSDLIENVAQEYGIDMMSRDVIYTFMRQYASLDFWQSLSGGKGIEFCNVRLLAASGIELHNMTISALHNDFLKLDIEMGFAGYLLWLAYTVFVVPVFLRSRFDARAKTAYIMLMVFSFIVYATDNTTTYPVFQIVLFVILGSATFAEQFCADEGGAAQ